MFGSVERVWSDCFFNLKWQSCLLSLLYGMAQTRFSKSEGFCQNHKGLVPLASYLENETSTFSECSNFRSIKSFVMKRGSRIIFANSFRPMLTVNSSTRRRAIKKGGNPADFEMPRMVSPLQYCSIWKSMFRLTVIVVTLTASRWVVLTSERSDLQLKKKGWDSP